MKYPLIVKWSITDSCNLQCKHCFRSNKHKSISRDEIDIIIDDLVANEVACVALTGGEPMIHEDFFYIIEKLNEKGVHTEIATNGTLLNERIIKKLKDYKIGVIQISLDGADHKINDFIRGNGTYNKVLNAIKFIKQGGLKVTLAVTLNHMNCNQIDSFVELKKQNRVDYLRFELFIPVNKDNYKFSLQREDISFIAQCADKYTNDKTIVFPNFSQQGNCGAGIYMAMINTDMTISPCDLLCDEVKSRLKISEVHGIRDVWNTDECINSWRKSEFVGCVASALKYKQVSDPYLEIYEYGKK